MGNHLENNVNQLKTACRLTKARWAVWFRRIENAWVGGIHASLKKDQILAIQTEIARPGAAGWLSGAAANGRARSRSLGSLAAVLGCNKMYAYPAPDGQAVLLVGGDGLTRENAAVFQTLSQINPYSKPVQIERVMISVGMESPGPELTFDPQTTFDWVLSRIGEAVAFDAAYLAVRRGDAFIVEAHQKWRETISRRSVRISGQVELERMTRERIGFNLDLSGVAPSFLMAEDLLIEPASCLGAPIHLGNRVIGVIVLISSQKKAYSPETLTEIDEQLKRIAHGVETAIAFYEISRHLQQFALVDELASITSIETDVEVTAQKIIFKLKRAFRTDSVFIFLYSKDGKTLRQTGRTSEDPGADMLGRLVAEEIFQTDHLFNCGNLQEWADGKGASATLNSVLGSPLNFRGKPQGIIVVGSSARHAFNDQDEDLLTIITHHVVTIIENLKLHQETREFARGLDLIHQLVGHIVNLNNPVQIARETARLMVDYFDYDIVMVLLADELGEQLINAGVAGRLADQFPQGKRFDVREGILGHVYQSGQGYLSNDLMEEPHYIPDLGHKDGLEICLPLKDGDKVFGVMQLERGAIDSFYISELALLESLIGILSSVLANAFRYSELQVKIQQLQAARETALDISIDLDLETLFKRIIRRIKDLTKAEGAALGLVNPEARTVQMVVHDIPWYKDPLPNVPFGTGVVGRVAETGRPIIIRNYQEWNGRIERMGLDFASTVGIPLIIKDQVMGVLLVTDDRPEKTFRDEDIALMQLLAPQMALLIRNAQLYLELAKSLEIQHATEKRLMQSAKLAALGELAAGVAHEINNPLTSISGFVELALEELPDDLSQKAELRLVLNEAHRARGVVRRLLDFARQTENVRVLADINDLVQEVSVLIAHLAHSQRVDIIEVLAQDVQFVYVDPGQIKQVILNLAQNGIQAMPSGGTLTLQTGEAQRDGHRWAVITVIDTGEGIPGEHLDRIFEPFFTTRPVGQGTGLGLSVSYGLVTEHGGFIDVNSNPGLGSRISVWLPIDQGGI
jgi:signal transduction histidine kinase